MSAAPPPPAQAELPCPSATLWRALTDGEALLGEELLVVVDVEEGSAELRLVPLGRVRAEPQVGYAALVAEAGGWLPKSAAGRHCLVLHHGPDRSAVVDRLVLAAPERAP